MAEEQDGNSLLDTLLAKMPQIAEAVSKFPEAVQQQASTHSWPRLLAGRVARTR